MRADVHMHTSFSYDSDSEPEAMVQGAIDKGLEVICFTDHYDKDYIYENRECVFDLDRYFEVLTALRSKYEGRLDIRIGVELGLMPGLGPCFSRIASRYPFDFIIGSVHVVQGMDPAMGEIFREHTDEEAYRMTFQETLNDIRNVRDFDVLGHVDYVVRYSKGGITEYSYSKYADEIDAVLKELIAQGKGIEVNMAGLKYGLPFAHPHPDILKRYRELGGEIVTVGADGHRPEHIAYDFHLADELLTSCGFKYYTEFKGRKAVFKQLP